MKETDKKKPVPTVPQGVWEASPPADNSNEEGSFQNVSVDLQGNGYVSQREQKLTKQQR